MGNHLRELVLEISAIGNLVSANARDRFTWTTSISSFIDGVAASDLGTSSPEGAVSGMTGSPEVENMRFMIVSAIVLRTFLACKSFLTSIRAAGGVLDGASSATTVCH